MEAYKTPHFFDLYEHFQSSFLMQIGYAPANSIAPNKYEQTFRYSINQI